MAKMVHMDFMLKRQMNLDTHGAYYIKNNGEIKYPYTEAESKGISRASFQRAIDELIEKGFLSITRTGAGVARAATEYHIDDRWKLYGTNKFEVRKRPRKSRWNKSIGFQKGHIPHNKKPDTIIDDSKIIRLIDDNTGVTIDDNTESQYYRG
jgi:hypothetical protein